MAERLIRTGKISLVILLVLLAVISLAWVGKWLGAQENPSPAEQAAVFNQARQLFQGKNYAEAVPLYRQFLQIAPANPDAFQAQVDLAQCYAWLNDEAGAAGAIQQLQGTFHDHPDISKAFWDIGQIYYNRKEYAVALSCYQTSVQQWPAATYGCWALAGCIRVSLMTGDMTQADILLAELETGYDDQPLKPHALWYVAFTLGEIKEHARAHQLRRTIAERYQGSEYALWALRDIIVAAINQRDFAAARAGLEEVLSGYRQTKNADEVLLTLAQSFFDKRQLAEFGRICRFLDEQLPPSEKSPVRFRRAKFAIIDAIFQRREEAQILAAFTALTQDFADNKYLATTGNELGTLCTQRGLAEAAEAIFRHGIEHWTDNERFWAEAGLIRALLHTDEPAALVRLAQFRAEHQQHPGYFSALLSFGEEFYRKALQAGTADSAQVAQAVGFWDEIIAAHGEDTVQALYWKGNFLFQQQIWGSAIEVYTALLGQYPTFEFAWDVTYRLGHCYREMKNLEAARTIWTGLLSEYPSCPAAQAAASGLNEIVTH